MGTQRSGVRWAGFAWLAAAMVAVTLTPREASAETVSVFSNGSYVDASFGGESFNVQNTLGSLGHSVSTFTGFEATDWQDAFAAADVVLVPSLDQNLASDLAADALTAIHDNVAAGKALIVMGDLFGRGRGLLNDTFGYSLATGTTGAVWSLDSAAASGTSFDGLAASLPVLIGSYPLSNASLPTNATPFYANVDTTGVAVFEEGDGYAGFLAWDWFNGSQDTDGDWATALDATVAYEPQPIPSPTAAGVGLLCFALLAARRGRRAAA